MNPYQQCQYGQQQSILGGAGYTYCQQNGQSGALYTYNSYTCQYQLQQYCQFGCQQPQQQQQQQQPNFLQQFFGGYQQQQLQSTQCAPQPQPPQPNPNPNPNPPPQQNPPVANISCGGADLFDVGMKVPITFSCQNSVSSTGSGFDTRGQVTGTSSPVIQKPPAGTDTVSYGLTCTGSNGQTVTNKCDVKINKPSIALVANPERLLAGKTSVIGWVTPKDSMKECVISSPTLSDFTAKNASIKSTSGSVKTPPLTKTTQFDLRCITAALQDREASTTVTVIDASGNEIR